MFLVSVWMTTYNHERFIAKAIDSVLMQKTKFDFEIIIGEDCSEDKTRDIVISYQKKYPDKIKLFLPEQNIGCNPMFYATYPLCNGKYVAWLDGDDYWTDPYKLQKQVDIMEENSGFVFCFHKVRIVDGNDKFPRESFDPPRNADDTLSFEHFLGEINPVNTPSFLYRNILGNKLPDWFYSLSVADIGFYFLLLKHGKGKYLEDEMAVYRVHKGGAWSGASLYQKNYRLAIFNQKIQPYLPEIYKEKLDSFICFHYSILFELDFMAGNYREAFKYLEELKKHGFKGFRQRKLWVAKMLVKMLFKPFIKYLKS
jgi:glycosyltransferase involved in cell wall biosynthesis